MNAEQKAAYEWAKNQNYPSVAARNAKLLAEVIDNLTAENDGLRAGLEKTERERVQTQMIQKACYRCNSKDPREMQSMKILQYKYCPECGRKLRKDASHT